MSRSPRTEGFTLVELLVVLAIVSMAITLAFPFARNGLQAQELKSFADRIASEFRLAQQVAMMTNDETNVVFDLEKRTLQTAKDRTLGVPERFKLTLLTATGEVRGQLAGYRFYPDGASTGGRILIEAGDEQRTVTVDWLTGQVKIHWDNTP